MRKLNDGTVPHNSEDNWSLLGHAVGSALTLLMLRMLTPSSGYSVPNSPLMVETSRLSHSPF